MKLENYRNVLSIALVLFFNYIAIMGHFSPTERVLSEFMEKRP